MTTYTSARITVHINKHSFSYFIRFDKTNMEHWNTMFFGKHIDDEIRFIFSYLITIFNPLKHNENSPLTYCENNHHFTIYTRKYY